MPRRSRRVPVISRELRRRGSRRVSRAYVSAAAVACLALGLAGAGALGAGGPVDIRGTYDATSHVGGASYPQAWHVTSENLTTGAFRGVDTSPVGNFSIVGTVTGNRLTVTVAQGGYSSRGTATITVAGGTAHIAGTFVDSNGTRGTWASTFPLSGAHATTSTTSTTTSTSTTTTTTPTSAKRPTFTAVVCTIAVTSSSSSCTGQVADAGVQRSNPPTGTVTFSAASGTVGTSCTLAGTPGSPGIASCTVSYIPSANLVQGEPPPVSADYSGDATFAPSSGASSYQPASVLVPSTVVATPVGGIPNNLINQNPYVVSADERLTVPGNTNTVMLRAGVASPAVAATPKQIGSASYKLRPLASIAATIKLTAAGRKLLAKHKTLNAVLTITTTAAGKPTKTATRHLTLKTHA